MVQTRAISACFLLLSASHAARVSVEEWSNKTMRDLKVEFYVTRHAMSCANVVKMYATGGEVRQKVVSDPIIPTAGEYGSFLTGQTFKDITFDGVVASTLIRAMQTAQHQYPGKDVYVAPYIREMGGLAPNIKDPFGPRTEIGYDNWPEGEKEQKTKLADANLMSTNRAHATGQVKFLSDTLNVDLENAAARLALEDLKQSTPDWNLFLPWFGKHLLPIFAEDAPEKDELTIALVTHSMFMHKEKLNFPVKACEHAWTTLSPPEDRPLNNQVVSLSYTASDAASSGEYKLEPVPGTKKAPDGSTYDIDCEEKARGHKYYKENGICESDVGKQCYLQAQGAITSTFMPTFLEAKQEQLFAEAEKKKEKYAAQVYFWDPVAGDAKTVSSYLNPSKLLGAIGGTTGDKAQPFAEPTPEELKNRADKVTENNAKEDELLAAKQAANKCIMGNEAAHKPHGWKATDAK